MGAAVRGPGGRWLSCGKDRNAEPAARSVLETSPERTAADHRSLISLVEQLLTDHGRERSYLSAACAAPDGFTIGVFPFVRVGMTFEDGRKLASTLIRTCRVKKERD